jgi:hypothetical protein
MENLSDGMLEVILRSKQIVLEDILNDKLRDIIPSSWLSEPEVQALVLTSCRKYNECHFEMLLREIVIKRLDFSYYLDWIIEHVSRPSTSREVRYLISSAAKSVLSDEEVIHSDDLFTAYSGFFLLANQRDKDIEAIINTLEDEEGVTREGIRKARMLISSFLIAN